MKQLTLAVLLAGFLGSCAPVISARLPLPVPAPEREAEKRGEGEWSLRALGIPNGHMPPPGSCRIWYPNREPGHQPPPFKCGIGRVSVPLGAFLVQRLDGKLIQVDEYDGKRPNLIVRSGQFNLSD